MLAQVLAFALLARTVHSSELLPNVRVSFGLHPEPFELNVDPAFIRDVHDRVANTRLPREIPGVPTGFDGPPVVNASSVKDFWVNHYNWGETQDWINTKFKQYTTTVHFNSTNTTHSMPLHFVHHKSPRPNAIPLIFVHGWPGSFLEVGPIIDLLTHPPNESIPAFHVVAPSIPGFGFSPAPLFDGFGPAETGRAFNALMHQLNYTRYVYQGGDFGGIIFPYIASEYPTSLISGLSNFWLIKPNATDLARYAANETTPGETVYIHSLIDVFTDQESGYRDEMEAQPLTVAYALTDSPLGNAMWNYDIMREAVDPRIAKGVWTAQDIITWSMMYYIQGPYGAAHYYKEVLADGGFSSVGGGGNVPFVTQPVAISEFAYDIWYGEPLEWARRNGNVKRKFVHGEGGHFAAWQTPDLLVADIREWFGDREASGTSVFC